MTVNGQSYPIELCDSEGRSPPGSDGKGYYDHRFGFARIQGLAVRMRNNYAKHFPHLYRTFTHFRIQGDPRIHPLPE